ncbi:hypothetical protein [Metapseudomonas otitidis]|nr:hypothetical protein [Pseudomonas otitidis]
MKIAAAVTAVLSSCVGWMALFPSTIPAHGGHREPVSTINPDDLD